MVKKWLGREENGKKKEEKKKNMNAAIKPANAYANEPARVGVSAE